MDDSIRESPKARGEPARAEAPLPADAPDPVIEAYKRDVDRTLLRENLKLTVEERLKKLEDAAGFLAELRAAAAQSDPAKRPGP